MSFEAAIHAQAIDLGKVSLEMTAASGSGHPTTALSLAHIVTILMFDAMRWSPDYPDYPTSDRLVLSEGHAVPIVYAAACKLGVVVGKDQENRRKLAQDEWKTLREADSVLDGHPNPMEGFPFFDAATGSLGQGLSVALGLAEAARLDGFDKHIYCIIGDGESREGQITEAIDELMDRNLTNVCPIFNCNQYGQADRVSDQQSAAKIKARLEAAGMYVEEIDGHNPEQIRTALKTFAERSRTDNSAPMAIVANTVKGWGAPSIQGGGWHGKPPAGEALQRALTELDERRTELTTMLASTDTFQIEPPAQAPEQAVPSFDLPSFSQAMKQYDMLSLYQSGRMATRRAYGLALRALGHVSNDVVVLDADVSNSTFTEWFAKDSALSDRFIECKIAEQNMISMGVGLSAAGKVPFCSTFAKFLTRAYDQIEMAIYSGANLKVVGSHAGISLAADGPSQMSLPDIAWFRSLSTMRDHRGNPGCYVLQPADAFAAYSLTQAMAEYEGVCYMRTLRPETEFLYSDDVVFNLGGFEVLSKGRDVVLCTSGYTVHEANKALDTLDEAGVSATLVDLYSLPFDEEKLMDLIGDNGGYAITIEDNFGGSIGSAVADAITESGDGFTLKQIYVNRIPKSAKTPDQLMEMCGMTATDIANSVLNILEVA